MSGMAMTKLPSKRSLDMILLTPEKAAELLEHNTLNRPISDTHVRRLVHQIVEGKWQFNGDTIKIAKGGDMLDGQHRMWAVIEAKKSIETAIAYGVDKEAFSTIDTLRKPRSGADVIALAGETRYRAITASALGWLLRWQRGILEDFRAPQHRIENSDIEAAFATHPGIARAVERARSLRNLANQPIMAFLYYILANRNPDLAERMMATLEDPAGVATTDPFFKLRVFFTTDHHRKKEPLVIIALAIKAINAAHKGERINVLSWKNQGARVEDFPALRVG